MAEAELPFVRALKGETVIEEYQCTRPDTGAEVYLRAAAAPILDGAEIVGAVAIHTDLTELRQEAEKLSRAYEKADGLHADLKRQTAEVNAVLDALPDGLYIGDLQGVRRCNAQGLRLLGASRPEELNIRIEDLLERFDIRDAEGQLRLRPENTTFGRALQGETCVMNVIQTDLQTGQQRIVRSSGAPVVVDGAVIAAVTVSTDITDQIKAQAEIEALNEHLDQLVNERTIELTQANASLARALSEVETLKERLEAENAYLQVENDRQYHFDEVVGESALLQEVFYQIETVAPQDTTVLLLGETGTGKGMLARAIHSRSARSARPMVMVNCTALPANLIESELFGREKGAFTGADSRQIGRFELADKGTLFLDEVGDLPLELQAKLLHVLQEKEFSRLGSSQTIHVDVRIIAATNRDLKEEMAKGRFREDLYYRLNIFPVTVPPLRYRKEDIPLLVDLFMRKFCRRMGKEIRQISAATLARLVDHSWPGNVRELENVIERAVIITRGDTLRVLDRFDPIEPEAEDNGFPTLSELERGHILKVLKRTKGRIDGKNGAAAILGLNPSTLRGRMRKEGIQRFEWAAGTP